MKGVKICGGRPGDYEGWSLRGPIRKERAPQPASSARGGRAASTTSRFYRSAPRPEVQCWPALPSKLLAASRRGTSLAAPRAISFRDDAKRSGGATRLPARAAEGSAKVNAVAEGKRKPFAYILVRGQYDQRGEGPAAVPAVLPVAQGPPPTAGLARWLTIRPIRSRPASASRFWAQLFGQASSQAEVRHTESPTNQTAHWRRSSASPAGMKAYG